MVKLVSSNRTGEIQVTVNAASIFLLLVFSASYGQKKSDISKSVRVLNYTSYISDNSISSKGMSNTLEMYNYYFTNYSTLTVLTLGTENKYISSRNTFNRYFRNNVRLKNSLAFVDGNTMVNDTVRMYWDPMKKSWSPVYIMSKFPPRDTLVSSDVKDRFIVMGLGLHSYRNTVNFGVEGYLVRKAGDFPDRNAQLSLVMDFFKKRKLSAFLHVDLIRNEQYSKLNTDKLYFAEAELSARIRPFTFSINGGYGRSIFRYALLDNGYLEYTSILLKFNYGLNATINFPTWGGFFFNINRSGYYYPEGTLFTSFYGGVKIILKKY